MVEDRVRFEEQLRSRLQEIFSANPWIVAAEIEQGAVRLAGEIGATGGQAVLAVGARPGVGPVDRSIPLVSMDLPDAGSMAADIRTAHAALATPPPEVQAAVDAFDPDRQARVVGGLTVNAGSMVGRSLFGSRPPEWLALEDKLAIESLWAAAGIPVAPSAQVELADTAALLDCHRRLATDLGTVWAGDNTSGWHGGAQGTFWVPNKRAVPARAKQLDGYRKVRVMPFLEGVPCSIHGMVLPQGSGSATDVAVFRPCEMMMLRDREAQRLVYGRIATFWDPDPADRLAMADVARRVGAELRRAVDYRGVFTVDGIMTADGFRPTEVNTRYGAALASAMATESGEPIHLFQIHLALVEGLLDDVDLAPLERWAVANLEANRRAVGHLPTAHGPDVEMRAEIRRQDGELTIYRPPHDRPSGDRPPHDRPSGDRPCDGPVLTDSLAEVNWGQAPSGGLAIVTFNDGNGLRAHTAPLLVEIANLLNDEWDMGMPALEAAQQVR